MHVRRDVTAELAETIACMLHATAEMRPTARDVGRDLARIAASVTNDPAPVSFDLKNGVARERLVALTTGRAGLTGASATGDAVARALHALRTGPQRGSGAAHVVGPAGAGKSRLAADVGARARGADERVSVVTTRSDPLGAGAPFAVAAAIAIDLRDLREHAKKHASAGSFAALLAGRGEDEAERAARVDPALMRDRLREAFRDAVEGAATVAPLLLVVDDVQWVDAASMRLLEDVIDRGRGPLFVLSLARPDPDAPGARSVPRLGSMELAPIDASAAAALARAVTGDGASATTIDRIVRLGDGNAFFLEELARAAATGGSTPLPESVVALTQSRLAAFPPLARRVRRAASIVRPRVTEAAVEHLVGAGAAREEIAATLDELVRSEVLVRRDASFDFRHELLAEAEYATLTENDARRGHLAAAAFAESTGSADPRRVAEHLERGGDRLRGRRRSCACRGAHAAERRRRRRHHVRRSRRECGVTGDMLGRVHARRLRAGVLRGGGGRRDRSGGRG